MSKREVAKRLLVHYLRMAIGEPFSPDFEIEIRDIVDLIIESCREER